MKVHREGNNGQLMEIEENRGIIDKKVSEDKFMVLVTSTFCQFSFGALSLSLSYSWTLRVFLEHSWRSMPYLGFRATRQRKRKKVKENIKINNWKFCLKVPSCIYDFLVSFDIHGHMHVVSWS